MSEEERMLEEQELIDERRRQERREHERMEEEAQQQMMQEQIQADLDSKQRDIAEIFERIKQLEEALRKEIDGLKEVLRE